MALRINHNISALNSHSQLVGISSRLDKSIERLSSGLRINHASDDAAGLTISEKLRTQVRGLARATLNAQDGISMIQSAEGALNETHSILQRMRELAIQSSNDTLTSHDRLEIQKEVNQLRDDINRIAYNTEFNTKKLLDGSQAAIISTSSLKAKGIVTGDASKSAGDYRVSLALLSGGSAQLQRTKILTVKGSSKPKLAQGSTELQSIAQFYDANNVFVLDEPQELTIHGNSKTTSVTLDAHMTLSDMSGLIQAAVVDEKHGLGMKNSVAKVVQTSQTTTANLGGYVELVSGLIGDKGRISFAGNQTLIDSLGFSVSRAAKNNFIEVSLEDENKKVRTMQTDTDRASGLLNGIDVQFDSQTAQIAGSNGLRQGLYFSASDSFNVAAGSQNITLVLGSGYRTMEGIARSFNAQAASTAVGPQALHGLSAEVIDGEIRLSYVRPASASMSMPDYIKITNASGSKTLGFQNGSYGGFVEGRKNKLKMVWGFSKFRQDIASGETSAIKVGDGIATVVLNISTALGTADGSITVADMVDFDAFKADANQRFHDASVAVRLDQIDGAMVFTSTKVGKDNKTATLAYSSVVTIEPVTATGAVISATESMLKYFGIEAGTRSGSGDTNFTFHVKSTGNQYQIGANQNQNMKVSMSDMSALALGVDNLDMTNIKGAEMAIGKLDKAIDKVSSERAKFGAYQNRLEHAINNLRNEHTNASASESRIRDADIAQEMIGFTSNQVLSQSATAMLAQANSNSKGILRLLQ